MSWLTKMAIEASHEALPCQCDAAYKDRGLIAPDCPRCQFADVVADAIEKVAREFAERALRSRLDGLDDAWVAEAIAEADKASDE